MIWPHSPFFFMSLVNVGSGLFSLIAGLYKVRVQKFPLNPNESNPWLYVLGGAITNLVGLGNWFQFSIATWGTILFILTSIYDGWFGAGSKDWRFFTLSIYLLIQTSLVVWSTQVKSIISIP